MPEPGQVVERHTRPLLPAAETAACSKFHRLARRRGATHALDATDAARRRFHRYFCFFWPGAPQRGQHHVVDRPVPAASYPSGSPGGRLLQTSCFSCSSTAPAVRLLYGLGRPGHGLCYLSCWRLSSIGCIWRPHARYTTTRATPPHNNCRSAIAPANPPHDDSRTPTTQ